MMLICLFLDTGRKLNFSYMKLQSQMSSEHLMYIQVTYKGFPLNLKICSCPNLIYYIFQENIFIFIIYIYFCIILLYFIIFSKTFEPCKKHAHFMYKPVNVLHYKLIYWFLYDLNIVLNPFMHNAGKWQKHFKNLAVLRP